ncbi:hypothetical protein SAMN05661008_00801 [Alkalithermobacter thermoalcaliphilus JW-YL-7 = DSM 7308]|uniref:Uncharacterized protein n=1 Tax=Alkalithermobacter thermoalcaliphilus JW-YL-7 = DSM 7308 TaxID=1121328 RepID=A0A150FSA0_CLOPD|nr:hypothetical protein JWYL7_1576 [[Clostridium] paradoxum JW-YL-7 = DSM 7308]SHK72745.1 hypothetical protein SAMN05661008_00801 [[Clostridium] paradoxum JW-YL-7 = DSM 7308]
MKINWNTKAVMYGVIAILLVVGGFLMIPRLLGDKAEVVEFTMVERNNIPQKILDIMPKYIDEERALSCKIDEEIYVIVTRGQNKEHGVEIEKIELEKQEDKVVMKVYSVYKSPEDAHPYVVVKTNLKELPDKIELINRVEEK